MNHNKNVVVFTLVTTAILLVYSLYSAVSPHHLPGLDNISIVSDVLQQHVDTTAVAANGQPPAQVRPDSAIATGPVGPTSVDEYKKAHLLTNFSTDATQPALAVVMHKLYELKRTGKGKVR